MARRPVDVTWKEAEQDTIPDLLTEGAVFVIDLDKRNMLEPIGRGIRIRRQGGYCGFDILLFLLFFFASGTAFSIKEFWYRLRPFNRKLAAITGRRQLPSSSAVSRALSVVEPELLRPFSQWLLFDGAGIDAVLRHPSVLTYDAQGRGWHVFDFDPTVTTLRHRALPQDDDLPEPWRRSAQTAAPGYSGRKRGNVQFRRGTLQHAGSSAWLQAMLEPGNGDGKAELKAALEAVVGTCKRLDHPLNRAMMRMDGEFGWVPYLTMCRAFGVPCITRLTRPEMFEQPEVMRMLSQGTWHMVPDSLSGPRRSALDLGLVTVPPGKDTRKEDGTAYEPVTVRVVVSRYPRTGKAEHGCVIEGWQYEMFVVDVDADALPAPEAVAAFFGRGGEENRFAQEDRELGLDRIFSYHLPGQELAVIVGLWVWNLRLSRGFELEPPPTERPVQQAYVTQVDLRSAAMAPEPPITSPPDMAPQQQMEASSDPASQDVVPLCHCDGEGSAAEVPPDPNRADQRRCSAETTSETASMSADDRQSDADDRHSNQQHVPESVGDDLSDAGSQDHEEPSLASIEDELVEALSGIDWNDRLGNRPGWWWDQGSGHLRCPDGRKLVLTTVYKKEQSPGITPIIFCRPLGGCEGCDKRSGCFRSARPRASRHFMVSAPTAVAARLRELLRARRCQSKKGGTRRGAQPAGRSSTPRGQQFQIAPLATVAAVFSVLPSLFLPATARSLVRAATAGVRLKVNLSLGAPPAPKPVLLAESVGDKQRRRKTWQQNLDRYALRPEARVLVEIRGDDEVLRRMLCFGREGQAAA